MAKNSPGKYENKASAEELTRHYKSAESTAFKTVKLTGKHTDREQNGASTDRSKHVLTRVSFQFHEK